MPFSVLWVDSGRVLLVVESEGVSDVIAEVIHMRFPDGAGPSPSGEAANLAEEAAHAPGSEELLTLIDPTTHEGYVIHLWTDRAAYDSFAKRREELIVQTTGQGPQLDSEHIFEVSYHS